MEDRWHELPCGHEVLHKDQVHYCAWVAENLTQELAHPFAGSDRARDPVHPEEGNFLALHQMTERGFVHMVFELKRAIAALQSENYRDSRKLLTRIRLVFESVHAVMKVFHTMTKDDLFAFRDHLAPASGMESINYRRIEILCGITEDRDYCTNRGIDYRYREFLDRPPGPGENDPKTRLWTDELSRLMQEPTLLATFDGLLQAKGIALKDLLEASPCPNDQLKEIADEMYLLDEQYYRYRQGHFAAAVQKIGQAPGTGHTDGAVFLRSTLRMRLFPNLYAIKLQQKKAATPGGGWEG